MNMSLPLPEEYISMMFLIYAGYARRKGNGIFEGGCPICREGTHWGSKRRCFYIPDYNNIHCKNCNRSWEPKNWIATVSSKSYHEILMEAKDYEYIPAELILQHENKLKPLITDKLPRDSIDLYDKQQLTFYKDNPVLAECIRFIVRRRLNKAVNKPKTLYLSLNDPIHKNRLCIPFYDLNGDVIFYQTRTVLDTDNGLPKYLSKAGGGKGVFGIDRVSSALDYMFIFEGPIDSMFVRNGVAVGGIDLNSLQRDQLKQFPLHEKIWVLDNQHVDKASMDASKELLKSGERVFIWDKTITLKDYNDICCAKKVNELSTDYIVKNSFTGIQGTFRLNK